jgi:hypothetical protein
LSDLLLPVRVASIFGIRVRFESGSNWRNHVVELQCTPWMVQKSMSKNLIGISGILVLCLGSDQWEGPPSSVLPSRLKTIANQGERFRPLFNAKVPWFSIHCWASCQSHVSECNQLSQCALKLSSRHLCIVHHWNQFVFSDLVRSVSLCVHRVRR